MQRIMIVGSAGSGKSRLARRLGALLDLPVVHLDSLYWRPGWVEPSQEVWREQVREAVQANAWVMDGNYSATMDLRFERADMAVFLDIPRRVCLYRVLKRGIMHRGRVRSDCAPGCPERLQWFFLKWVWTYPAQRRPATVQRLENAPPPVRVVHLRSNREIERFLREVGDGK